VVEDTFNMISVDGDTSTNDMVLVMSNSKAGHEKITAEDASYTAFKAALYELLEYLSMTIAKDGEGASKLLKAHVTGAHSKADARLLAKGVITSSLVKSAFFGADANWGRIISALGASGGYLDPDKVDLTLKSPGGSIDLMKAGSPLGFDEETAKAILLHDEIDILITLGDGEAEAKAYGCDLTYDYVKINADYRS
jgi:glutamate N-acetyltransferase/amino-acid N-acetyltransferase